MAGYTRTDTTDNIANNKIANADDLDNELNAIQSAFNALTGHTHDGAAGTGAPITKVGPAQDVVISATTVLPKTAATVDLGSSTFKFKDAWLSGTVTAPSFAGNLTGAVTGNAATATKLATARTLWGQSFDGTANVSGNLSSVNTITGAGNLTLIAPGNSNIFLTPSGTGTVSATRINGLLLADNDSHWTTSSHHVESIAAFNSIFTNKLRFITPTSQEESADGTTWVASTRATAQQLADLMIGGGGQTTAITAIPAGTVGVYDAYRLTWDNYAAIGYTILRMLYIYMSSANATQFKIEAYHNTNGWETITDIAAGGAAPGPFVVKHPILIHNNISTAYVKLRVTFSITHSSNTTGLTLYGLEWAGQYPTGRSTVESFDSNKNVTWPASVLATSLIPTGTTVPVNGMYRPTTNTVGIATNTTERVRINEVGSVGIGVGLTSLPDQLSLLGPSGAGGNIGMTIGGGVGTSASPSVTNLNFRGFSNRRTAVIKSFDQTSNSNISGGLEFLVNGNMAADTPTSAMRIDGTGITGIGITPTTRNNTTLQIKDGIGFPATQIASSDPNTLDDYEEGTWTPIIEGRTTAGVGTYSFNFGYYTKIGNRVFFHAYLTWTAHTGTGGVRIPNLPFTSSAGLQYPAYVVSSDFTFTGQLAGSIVNTTTNLDLVLSTSNTALAAAGIDTTGTIYIAGHYHSN